LKPILEVEHSYTGHPDDAFHSFTHTKLSQTHTHAHTHAVQNQSL